MFRYERPQKGRLRQFHQIDVELMGAPSPADIEVISLAADILDRWASATRRARAQYAGRPESRIAYRDALVDYSRRRRRAVGGQPRAGSSAIRCASSTARTRATRRSIAERAAVRTTHLNQASRDFFGRVQDGLRRLGTFELDPAPGARPGLLHATPPSSSSRPHLARRAR